MQQLLWRFRKSCNFCGIPPILLEQLFGKSAKVAATFAEFRKSAYKNAFFGGFLPVFCPVSCFFTDNLCMKCLFCKKKSFHLTFSSRRSASYKVPPRIGGHHFLLCQ